jgi:hypothetical protein
LQGRGTVIVASIQPVTPGLAFAYLAGAALRFCDAYRGFGFVDAAASGAHDDVRDDLLSRN